MNKSPHGRAGARRLAWLLTLAALVAGSGATCQRPILNPFGPVGPSAPQVLPEAASRDQIIAAVNQNSGRIQSLTVTGAAITIPDTMGLPILSGNIAAERPGRFRLTASTGLSGQELDLGSNDELFWLWIRRNQPAAVYFCRHEQFAGSAIRQVMPVEPSWLLSALGMVAIDPASVYDGPLPRGDGRVELRTRMASASGTLHRVLVIDARRAWVVEQHVYDSSGTTLLASAVAETHRYYPQEQLSLPDRLSIRLPTAGIALKIDLGTMRINQLAGDPRQLWTMPVLDGVPQVDLGGAAPGGGAPLPGRLTTQPESHGLPAHYALPAGHGLPATQAGGHVLQAGHTMPAGHTLSTGHASSASHALPAPYPAHGNVGYSQGGLPSAPTYQPGAATSGSVYQPLPQYGRRLAGDSGGANRKL